MTPNFYESKIQAYYDHFSRYLLKDYVYGNKRIEFAIRHALQWIPPNAKKVLDVGCGIGWSSWTFQQFHMNTHVTGVDLGHRSITIAKNLFEMNSLEFCSMDFSEDNTFKDRFFDAIILLDVYEHFRQVDRPHIHQAINRLLTESGILFLSYPSVNGLLQDYSERPENLQPVDEFVTSEDIAKLAEEIHGSVVFNKEIGIFAPNDYTYTVISRGDKKSTAMPIPAKKLCFESLPVRRRRVQDRLNVRVTPSGTILPMREGDSICFMLSHDFTDRQILRRTFVEALPNPIRILSGMPGQLRCDDGMTLLPKYGVLSQLHHAIRRRTSACQSDPMLEEAFERFCRQNEITRVVADTVNGASVLLPMCQRAKIPLSVWFPGPDEAMPVLTRMESDPDLAKNIKAFLCGSTRVVQRLGELGVPTDSIHLVPYGVETHLFDGARPEDSARLLVSVHDSLRTDEPELVLFAFREVLKVYPDVRLLMLGDSYLSRRGARLAGWLKIAHAVDFQSLVSEVNLARVLKQARAFICIQQAYLGTRETLVHAVIAAMSAGLPIIATPSETMAELIGNNCGALVGDNNIDLLIHEMCRVIGDPSWVGKMGDAARRIACSNYCLSENISSFLTALQ